MSQPPLPKVAGHPRSIAVAQYQHDLSGGESRLSDRGRAWPNEHSCSPAAQHPRESPSTEPTADVQPWPRERVLMPQKPPSIFDSRIVGVEWKRELQRSHLLQPGYQRCGVGGGALDCSRAGLRPPLRAPGMVIRQLRPGRRAGRSDVHPDRHGKT